MADAALIAIGVVAMLAGLALLRLAWGRKQGARGMLLTAAWLLVLLAVTSWGVATGERGAAGGVLLFAVLGTAIVALLFARAAPPKAEAGAKTPRNAANDTLTPGSLARRIWVFVLVGPLSAVATTLLAGLGYMLTLRAGGATSDAVVVATVSAPLIWSGLMCWLLMDANLLRRTFGVAGAAALGATAYLLS